MSDSPDPKVVRETAREQIINNARNLAQDDEKVYESVAEKDVCASMTEDERWTFGDAVLAEIGRAQTAVTWPDEQPQDDGDVRIAELEREVRQLRAGAPRAWKQDLRSALGRFENFVNATRSYDSDHLGGIMRGGSAEATITLGDLRAVLARLAELEAHPWMVVDPEQNERDGDVRAVAEVAAADDDAELDRAISDLIARFADRVEALEARDVTTAARERVAELAEHAEEER